MYVLVAEDHVSISPEQEVGLLMAESEICKVGVEKLLPLPLSLPSFLGDGSIQPLSEINHKGRSERLGETELAQLLKQPAHLIRTSRLGPERQPKSPSSSTKSLRSCYPMLPTLGVVWKSLEFFRCLKKDWDTYQPATALELGRTLIGLLAFEAEAETQPILALHCLHFRLLISSQQ